MPGSQGTARPSWHGQAIPCAQKPSQLWQHWVRLPPQRRIYAHVREVGTGRAWAPGLLLSGGWVRGRPTAALGSGTQGAGPNSSLLPRVLLCSCLLCSAESTGSKCCWGRGAGESAGWRPRSGSRAAKPSAWGDGCGLLSLVAEPMTWFSTPELLTLCPHCV